MVQSPIAYYRVLRGRQAFARGEALAAEGKAAEAAEAFDLAAALSAREPGLRLRALTAAADLYQGLGRGGETAERAERLADLAPEDPEVVLRLARARDIIGRREDAAAAWARRLELAPDCDQALRRLADLLTGAAAIPHLRALAERTPDDLSAWIRLGEALTAEGDFDAAAAAWTRRLALAPQCDEAPRRLADLLRGAAALPHIRTLAERAPGDLGAWTRLAQALDAADDPAGAAQAWSRVVELSPGDLDARRRLIFLLLALDRPAEATPQLEAAVGLAPDDAGLWKRLAQARGALGDVDGEIAAWAAVVAAEPERSAHRLSLARLLVEGGRNDEATPHLLALARLEPDEPEHWRAAARALASEGDADSAAKAWGRLLLLAPEDLEAHRAMAAHHRATQQPALAIPHLRFEADAVGGAAVTKRLALTLELIGEREAAEDVWRRLLAINPAHAEGLARLTALSRARGALREALALLQAAFAAAPGDLTVADRLAELQLELGDAEGAVATLREVVESRPRDREALAALVRLQTKIGYGAAAVETLRAALEVDPTGLDLLIELAPDLPGDAAGLGDLLERAAASAPDDLRLLRVLARSAAARGDVEAALNHWSRLSAQAPEDTEAARAVGLQLYDIGRRADAAPYLAVAAAAAPGDLKVWRRLAWAQRGTEDLGGEARSLRHLLDHITPDDDETKLRLIEVLIAAQRRGEAEPLLAEMADKRPDDIRLRTHLARARRDLGDEAGALEAWRQVLAVNPGEPDANNVVGEALLAAGEPAAGLDHLAAAAPTAAKPAVVWQRIAKLRRGLKDHEGEMVALENLLTVAAVTTPTQHQRLAMLLEAHGRAADAEPSLLRLIADSPRQASLRRRLAASRRARGDLEAEADAWREVLDIEPRAPDAHRALAARALAVDAIDDVVDHLRAAGKEAGAELWTSAARALAARGDPVGEVEAWRAALEAEPDLLEAHLRLAALLVERGEGAAAAPHLAMAVQAAPDDLRLREHYGLVLHAAGRFDEAAEHFAEVARQRPTLPKPWKRYARALAEAGDQEAALQAWRHVLTLGADEAEASEAAGRLLQGLGRFDEAAPYLRGHDGPEVAALRHAATQVERLGRLHAAFEQTDLAVLDVGARGGPLDWMTLLAPYARYYACEPEPAEAARLGDALKAAHPWREVRVVPEGLGAKAGEAVLKLTGHSGFSSLYQPSAAMAERFGLSEEMAVTGEARVRLVTLAQAAKRHGFQDLALLKVDTQGSELEVLKGGEALLRGAVQAVFAEVEFREFYEGQPLFGDVDVYLRGLGFELVRLEPVSRRRVTPGHKLPYSRHEAVWAHVLYVKPAPAADLPATTILKRSLQQVALAMAYELFDLAAERIATPHAQAAFAAAGLEIGPADVERFAAAGLAERLYREFGERWPDQIKNVPKAYTI